MNGRRKWAQEAIRMVAAREGVSADEVYKEIALAINAGRSNPDPGVQQMWRMLPCSGQTPTPDDVIVFAVEYLSGRQLN